MFSSALVSYLVCQQEYAKTTQPIFYIQNSMERWHLATEETVRLAFGGNSDYLITLSLR